VTPRAGSVLAHGHNLNNIGKGHLDDAINQIIVVFVVVIVVVV